MTIKTHIKAGQPWFHIDLKGVFQYRDLLWMLVVRDFVTLYKQSVLGPLWFIIQPLATTLVFTVIFGHVAKIGTDGIPNILFYMTGTVFWNYFQNCMIGVSNSLIGNASLFKKVYFPRIIVPLSLTISGMTAFLLNLFMLAVFYFYFLFFKNLQIEPSMGLLLFPLLLAQCAALGLGVGLWMSAVTVKYRDLKFALPFLAQFWMYLTPVVYPLSQFPEKWQWVLYLNPMTSVLESTRYLLFGIETRWFETLPLGVLIAFCVLITGLLFFNRVQRTFVDLI